MCVGKVVASSCILKSRHFCYCFSGLCSYHFDVLKGGEPPQADANLFIIYLLCVPPSHR